jgi:hydrogenase expression/formation protein HypE
MDPLMMANEGKMLFFVPAERADRCIQALSGHALGRQSAVIGTVIKTNTERACAGKLSIRTSLGTTRLVTMPSGDQLPRIC